VPAPPARGGGDRGGRTGRRHVGHAGEPHAGEEGHLAIEQAEDRRDDLRCALADDVEVVGPARPDEERHPAADEERRIGDGLAVAFDEDRHQLTVAEARPPRLLPLGRDEDLVGRRGGQERSVRARVQEPVEPDRLGGRGRAHPRTLASMRCTRDQDAREARASGSIDLDQ
jgi:hypothetical protein